MAVNGWVFDGSSILSFPYVIQYIDTSNQSHITGVNTFNELGEFFDNCSDQIQDLTIIGEEVN